MLSPSTPGNKDQTLKECGCKGIRTCLLCQDPSLQKKPPATYDEAKRMIYGYCLHCRRAWLDTSCPENLQELDTSAAKKPESMSCCHDNETSSMEFPGIHIIENFVTNEEEDFLDKTISCTPFMKSQSGRQKQDFGPKVNFKKRKLKMGSFNGLPSYSHVLYDRMKGCRALEDFEPVEMCNLEYTSDRGAHIDPHIDDIWVWGERLITLNLISDSILSFTHDSHPDLVIRVPLPRRSLIVVSGLARYEWKHSVDTEHISGRRLAMTFRELSDEFKEGGGKCEEGRALLDLAMTFQGCAVGSGS